MINITCIVKCTCIQIKYLKKDLLCFTLLPASRDFVAITDFMDTMHEIIAKLFHLFFLNGE